MAFRLRRSVKLAPGVRVNLNKGGPSVRVGPQGAGVTVATKGTRATAGIPGTGLSFSGKVSEARSPGWGSVGRIALWVGVGLTCVFGLALVFA
jgi:hypothetical protein